jgi:hypothetical protein
MSSPRQHVGAVPGRLCRFNRSGLKVAERQEMLVSAVPLMLRVERGAGTGELRVVAEGFDPVELATHQRLVLRSEGHGVVIEREPVEQ